MEYADVNEIEYCPFCGIDLIGDNRKVEEDTITCDECGRNFIIIEEI